jgi:endonuclease-3
VRGRAGHSSAIHSVGTPARAAVAARLLAFGEELAAEGAVQVGGAFTDMAEADELVKASPRAFLFGVLFTQGVPAQRAWAGPWLLKERLGHLDLERLAAERGEVDAAVCARPALHRFKHTIAGWVSDMAARLLECYGGDPATIWAPGSTVAEVSERLAAFPGIGRKKAAMAVEILRRHFGVEMEGVEEGTVAYDVHVRRVFLRSGLVDVDTPDAVAAAARDACPEAPGTLDLPAWLVGRQWCRPRAPRCQECRLGDVCARLVSLDVEGVGARAGGVPLRRA